MRACLLMAFLVPGLLLAPSLQAGEPPSAAAAGHGMGHLMGNEPYTMLLVDRLEYGDSDTGDSYLWDLQGWYGGDYNKLWLKSEGEGPAWNAVEAADIQALYSRLFTPYWSWQAGLRHEVRHEAPDSSYAVLGVQGLAPQRFETDVALFLSDDGDLTVSGEFEYDLLLTQRLVLQPRFEFELSAQDNAAAGLGQGLNSTELGVRLRYEIRRELAPYLGVRWERLHGDTRDYARAAGEPASVTSFVVGLRAWL